MTLKVKSTLISLFLLAMLVVSVKLFADYNALNTEVIANLLISEKIIRAETRIHIALADAAPDIETAKTVIGSIPKDLSGVLIQDLAGDEIHDLITVRMSFIRIDRLLKKISSGGTVTEPEAGQIHNELIRIEKSTKEFIESFRERADRERTFKKNVVTAIYLCGGAGIILVLAGFYRYSLRPILYLSSQVRAVKDRKKENIDRYTGRDEIGQLSDFTYQTLNELQKSSEALSRRLEIQYATSEILKEAQKAEDIGVFLKHALEITLSLKWLNVLDKGGIFLVDETDPHRIVLKAEKNFTEAQKKSCSEVPAGRCICGQAALTGKTTYKASIDSEHELLYEDITPHGHYCLPIKHEGKVLGVIALYIEENYAPLTMEADFLNTIAIIIAESLFRKKLTESEHLITRAVEESGEGVIITDRNGTVEYVNPAFERMTGFPEQEIIGKNLLTGVMPVDIAEKIREDVMQGNLWSGPLKSKRKDGAEYLEQVSVIPVKNEKGEVVKLVSISRDITRERMLEEQLRQAQRMEVIGRFAGGIAHDFNNILTTVTGYGSILLKEVKENNVLKNYADQILSSSKRAANLTRSLLAFSRKQVISLKPVDLNDIVAGVEKLLVRLIGEDIELKTLLTGRDLTVMADGGQIEQLLMNLATNARDAMPGGGLLTIETGLAQISAEYMKGHLFAKPGLYACVSVTDTGTGMDEKTKESIFEPFFTTKEVGQGTGLGLSIVYGIVKQHDGDINVYSEPGKGTTFKIYLPLAEAEIEKMKQVDLPPLRSGTETVLVAEDDDSVRMLIKEVLERAGYTVLDVADGEEALRLFVENRDRIRMLLLDIVMPKKNGRETYEEIRKIKPGIRTLFLSGYPADIIHKKGMLEPELTVISKPVSPDELLRKMRELLDG